MVLDKSAGLFAPFRYTVIAPNFSWSFLLSVFWYNAARGLQRRIIGSSLASTVRSARSSDGYTTMVGPGSWSIRLPSMFSMAEVPPTWVGLTKMIFSTDSELNVSMISVR